MRLSTEASSADGIMELLIKGMHLSMLIGMRWGLDIGHPEVAEFGKSIYRMDFMDIANRQDAESVDTTIPPEIHDRVLVLPITKMRRLNSLHKALTPERARETGVRFIDEGEFNRRRKLLLNTNRRRIAEKQQ